MILGEVLPENSEYVLGAYLVFFALLAIYLVIMSRRVARLEREIADVGDGPAPEGRSGG